MTRALTCSQMLRELSESVAHRHGPATPRKPRGLKDLLVPHLVATVRKEGWAGTSNGALLRQAEKHFEVFLTADQNLECQQDLAGDRLAVVVLESRTTRLADLEPLIPALLASLPEAKAGGTDD